MWRAPPPRIAGTRRGATSSASLCQASLLKMAGMGLVEAKRRLVWGGSASNGWATIQWLWMQAWSLGMRVASDSTRDPKSPRVGRSWKAVMVGLRRTVSAMRSDSTQGSRLRTMDLVMRTRPMVVPAGQVTAVAVAATVS